jgi:hypothetical protein
VLPAVFLTIMIEYLREELLLKVQKEVDTLGVGGLKGKISDGYHTFDELYDHRIALFIALCKALWNDPQYQTGQKSHVWRSLKHSDGTSFNGWFVMGIGKERGKQITYHLPMSKWNETDFCPTLEFAPNFDGHTSADVLKRLSAL